jgi:2-phosphosulfolactate phosphatase
MRIHVSFTPFEPVDAPLAIAIDVLRATSTITQALASGYERVLCCTDIEDAQALAAEQGPAVLGGERKCVSIPGFNFGNSPREYVGEPAAPTLVLSTTNGTRLLVTAAAHAERVLVASLLNLEAVVEAVRADGADELDILCAGSRGELCLDDAYVAGRIAELLDGDHADSATAAIKLAQSFACADDGLRVSQSARNIIAAGLEEDIAYCAQESIHSIVPQLKGSVGAGVEVTLP